MRHRSLPVNLYFLLYFALDCWDWQTSKTFVGRRCQASGCPNSRMLGRLVQTSPNNIFEGMLPFFPYSIFSQCNCRPFPFQTQILEKDIITCDLYAIREHIYRVKEDTKSDDGIRVSILQFKYFLYFSCFIFVEFSRKIRLWPRSNHRSLHAIFKII